MFKAQNPFLTLPKGLRFFQLGRRVVRHSITLCLYLFGVSLARINSGYTGECRVEDPKDEVLIDATRLAIQLEVELHQLSERYLKQTGRPLKVVLVSRAGQDLRQVQVLKRSSSKGSTRSISELVREQSSDLSLCLGQDCSANPVSVDSVRRRIVERQSDPSRRLDFSHVGFFTKTHPFAKERTQLDAGVISGFEKLERFWWSTHLLRPCRTQNPDNEPMQEAQADLSIPYIYSEGPINFFSDNPEQLKFKVIIPTPDIHDRLEALANKVSHDFAGEQYAAFRYNLAGHYQNPIEGNSAAFILETLVAALEPDGVVVDRKSAQQALVRRGYEPTRLALSGLKFSAAGLPLSHLVAPFFRLNTDEQPFFRGHLFAELVTELSVEEFMRDQGVLWDSIIVQGAQSKTTPEEARAIRLRAERFQKQER